MRAWCAGLLAFAVGCWGEAPTKGNPKDGPREAPVGEGKRPGKRSGTTALDPVAGADRPSAAGRPNVLVIVWDTVRADHLTPYGYELDTTPRLAALAKESVVFDRAVSPGMWTLPSHASLFTGLPESAHGATAAHHWLDKRFPTLAGHLFANGWSTYLFAANPNLQDHTGVARGFEVREFPIDEKWKKKAKDATMSKVLPEDASNTLGPKFKPGKYPSGRSADRTKDAAPVAGEALLAWLDERSEKERPFFATLNLMEAHVPRLPSLASRKALFTDEQIKAQLAFDQSFGYLLAYTVGLQEMTPEQIALVEQVYDASLRDLDVATGALLDKLAERGVLDDTIVIITSDHGEHLGDHHRADHKFSVYNALVRVPLIIRYPKAMPARREPGLVSVLDVFATVAELTGTTMPGGTQSRSLLQGVRDEVFTEMVEPTRTVFERMERAHPDFDRTPWERTYAAVEAGSLKCIRRSDGHVELYNMAADPQETTDLAPARTADASGLCARIEAWRATYPAYDPAAAAADEGPGELDAETKRRLVELGYLSPEEEPAAPGPGGRRKGGGQ